MKRVLASLLCILMLLTAMPLVSAANVDTPAVDTAYKFGMIQGNVSDTTVYYLAGGMNSYYLATTTDINAAIDVYLEAADGGYYFYTMADGAKTYINMVVNGTHVNGAYEAAASTIYTYDAAAGTIVADVDGAPYWFGTRNDKSYTTVGPCKTEYEGFYCQFYTADGSGAPEQPDLPDEPGSEELTIADAIALGASFPHNTYSTNLYKVTGVITEVYNTQYGNMYIADEAGNTLTIYGTYSADGSVRYDAMEVKPVAGDTVTIYGAVGQYNDVAQIKNGWIVAHTPGEGGGETPDPDVPSVPDGDSVSISFVDVANRVSQSADQQVWKQNGITVTNDKGASTSNVADYANPARFYKSSTVTIEYPGMTMIVIEGQTTSGKDYATPWSDSFSDSNAVASVDGTTVTIVFTNPVDSFAWETLSAQARAFTMTVYSGEIGNVPVDPPVDPEPSEDPEADTELPIVDAIALGASKEHNTYTEGKYYVTGVITEVYNTQYGNMKIADEAGNILTVYGTWSADGETRYDALEVKPVAGDTVTVYGIIGQYNGTPQIKNGWITEHIPGEGGGDTPSVPSDDPTPDTELSIADAIALGASKEHNTYTEGKYYVTGVITEVYNTTYGNMYITDGNGNTLTIYGTYNADGSVRYDAMEVKPVAGDTVTIYGAVGQYNGTAQIKNGWITAHTPGEGGGDNPGEPVIPDDYSALITFDADKANRLEYSTELQVWAENGITITNEKGASVSNVGDYAAPARFYKSSNVTIEYSGMTKIIIDCADLESKYINGWVETITDANATAVVNGQCVIITFAEAVDSFTWTELTAQSRANVIYVWGQGGDAPVEPPVETVGDIVVSTAQGKAGDTVNVTISITNNPGIISAKVKVFYDTAVLKLVGYENGEFFAAGYSYGPEENNPFVINWMYAIGADSTAELLTTLTFEVLADTAEGFYDITLDFDCEEDVFNSSWETVWFGAVNGGVNVVNTVPGDVDGNGKVNNRDLGMLQQYLNGYNVTPDLNACDVDGNNKVNNRDMGLLQQYLNGYNVELK